MLITAITGAIEPNSYSLSQSLSWKVTQDVQQKKFLLVESSDKTLVGTVKGVVPLLQPVRLSINGNSALLVCMRLVIDMPSGFSLTPGEQLTLSDSSGTVLGTFATCSPPDVKKLAHVGAFLLMSPSFIGLDQSSLNGIGAFVLMLRFTMWHKEPINWTTHALHLTSSGALMSSADIAQYGLSGGILGISNNKYSVHAGSAPLVVKYRPSWQNAGKVNTMLNGSGSCSSTASSSSGSTSGTSGGSGGGSGGSGGSGGGSGGSGGGSGGGGCVVRHKGPRQDVVVHCQ